MFNFEEFKGFVKNEVKLRFPSADVHLIDVKKENGIQLTGILIKEKNCEGEKILTPIIYLNHYFLALAEGEVSLADIVNDICCRKGDGKYFDSLMESQMNDFKDMFDDYEKIRRMLRLGLMSRDKNRDLLESNVHIPFLDLEIVFYLDIFHDEYGYAMVKILKDHLDLWGVTPEELKKDAYENISFSPPVIRPILEVIEEMVCGVTVENDQSPGPPLYVLTNESNINGAACILYPGVLKEFAGKEQIQSDLAILPSSIHEVLLLPVEEDSFDEGHLKALVMNVNDDVVAPEDFLSNEVYYYDRAADRICLARERKEYPVVAGGINKKGETGSAKSH